MNWKAVAVLFLIFSASLVTSAVISLTVPELGRFNISERITLNTGLDLQGDPVGGGGGPH